MKGSNDMKTKGSVVVVVAGMLLLAGASHIPAGQSAYPRSSNAIYANGLADGGCVRMKHSPVLGINIPITVWIDGELAGPFAKGHVFERFLTPGRHEVYASRPGPGRRSDSWYGTIDVARGETISFVVYCSPNRVILQPVGRID